jgi:general secretion pathway protein G
MKSCLSKKCGFTFIEIMFVVVIIGILLSIATPNIFKWVNRARVTKTMANMKTISVALTDFELTVGNCPTTDQGLKSLVQCPEDVSDETWGGEPYIEDGVVPRDGWKNDFLYKSPGEHVTRYDLSSKGRDARENTEDDIHNWPDENEKDF